MPESHGFSVCRENLLIVHFLAVKPLFDAVFPHRSCSCFTIHSTISTVVAISSVSSTVVTDIVDSEAFIVMPAIIPESHLERKSILQFHKDQLFSLHPILNKFLFSINFFCCGEQ